MVRKNTTAPEAVCATEAAWKGEVEVVSFPLHRSECTEELKWFAVLNHSQQVHHCIGDTWNKDGCFCLWGYGLPECLEHKFLGSSQYLSFPCCPLEREFLNTGKCIEKVSAWKKVETKKPWHRKADMLCQNILPNKKLLLESVIL